MNKIKCVLYKIISYSIHPVMVQVVKNDRQQEVCEYFVIPLT